jgi:hypothetical protein
MPFTFSHPAVVPPLNYFLKKRASLTALVIGSIIPDFEYFFRLHHRSSYSHTWAGLFWFDVPAGILLCFVYHYFIRESFYAHAPLFLKQRMAPYRGLNWSNNFVAKWPQIVLCIFLSALSHLVWDRVLHHSMPFIQSMAGYPTYTNFKIKTVGSYLIWSIHTFIGAFLVIFSLWNMPATKNISPNANLFPYWFCFFTCAVVVLLLQLPSLKINPDNVVIALINSVFLSCFFTSCLFAFRFRRSKMAWAKKEG